MNLTDLLKAINFDRFKKGEKEQVIKDFEKTEIARDLNKLYKAIETRQFS